MEVKCLFQAYAQSTIVDASKRPMLWQPIHAISHGKIRSWSKVRTMMVLYAIGFRWGEGTRSICEKSISASSDSYLIGSGSPARSMGRLPLLFVKGEACKLICTGTAM